MKLSVRINRQGMLRAIYDDRLLPLFERLGPVQEAQRRSHVEPFVQHGRIRWSADLTPVNGPVLGPFDRHADALTAEHAWLEAHDLGAPSHREAPRPPTA